MAAIESVFEDVVMLQGADQFSMKAAPDSSASLETGSSVSSLENYCPAGEEFITPQTYDVCPPHEKFAACAPTREAFDSSETYPVLLTRNPIATDQVFAGCPRIDSSVPFNTDEAVAFENGVFVGKFAMHVRGLESTRPGLFDGKRRLQHIVIQGRLKRPVAASALWTGHEWFQTPAYVPSSFVRMLYTAAAKMFSNSVMVTPELTKSGTPLGFMNPVLATAQVMNVSRPGEEPEMWSAPEDIRLLGPQYSDRGGQPMSSEKRRKHFDTPANLAEVVLQPDLVYTFHIWQHWAELSSYNLLLGINVDLCTFSIGQPLQIMAKDIETNEYLINLCIWHKALMFAGGRPGEEPVIKRSSSLANLKSSFKGLLGRKSSAKDLTKA